MIGDPTLSKTATSLKMVMNELKKGIGYLIEWVQEKVAASHHIVPSEIVKTLELYTKVFRDPTGLPPSRKYEHAIHLKEGVSIPNLRPYNILIIRKMRLKSWSMTCLWSLTCLWSKVDPISSLIQALLF